MLVTTRLVKNTLLELIAKRVSGEQQQTSASPRALAPTERGFPLRFNH